MSDTEDDLKVKKVGLFDLLNDISLEKKGILNEDNIQQYNPYMVNRGLSQQVDTILLANEMNKRPSMSKELQYDYLFYSVPARKRYGKWAKQTDDNKEAIEIIKTHYNVSQSKAEEYLVLFDKSEINNLKKLHDKGGKA